MLDKNSPLNFHVNERVIYNDMLFGGKCDNFKILTRGGIIGTGMFSEIPLAVVGKGYKVIQNDELFPAVQDKVIKSLAGTIPNLTCEAKDRVSYNGQLCIRDMVFPEISCHVGEQSKVAFRIVAINSFGRSAIRLYSGAIDFFCTNGMIVGAHDHRYARHTSGLQISGIEEHVKKALEVYADLEDTYKYWAKTNIVLEQVVKFLSGTPFSNALREKLLGQFAVEAGSHGNTVWALYSALTYFATHSDGTFAVRATANDNVAATLLKREEIVRHVIQSDAWKENIAA